MKGFDTRFWLLSHISALISKPLLLLTVAHCRSQTTTVGFWGLTLTAASSSSSSKYSAPRSHKGMLPLTSSLPLASQCGQQNTQICVFLCFGVKPMTEYFLPERLAVSGVAVRADPRNDLISRAVSTTTVGIISRFLERGPVNGSETLGPCRGGYTYINICTYVCM